MADESTNTNLFIQLKNASGAAVFPRIDLSKNHEGKLPVAKVDGIDNYALSTKVAEDIAAAKLAIFGDEATTTTIKELKEIVASKFEYTLVTTSDLPPASADTMYRIYFKKRTDNIGSAEGTDDIYDEYITLHSVVDGVDTYTWEKIGDTAIDISSKLDVTTFNSTIANYSTTTEVGTAISTALAAYDTATVADEKVATAKSEAIAAAKGETESQVAAAKSAITGGSTKTIEDIDDAKVDKTVTVNNKALSANIVLDGSDIALTGYTAVEGGVGIVATDSINAAFKRIDENFKTLSGDSTESIVAVVGRVSTLEGEMDAVEGRLDVVEPKVTTLESITKGYTTEGEIKAAVDAKAEQTAVDAVIGTAGTLTKAVAANTAAVATKAEKEYVDGIKGDLETAISGKVAQGDFNTLEGRVAAAEGEIDILQGALEGLLSAGAVKAALDLKANAADVYTKDEADDLFDLKADKADVDAVIGAEGTLTQAVAAKAEQSFVEEELAKKANSADLAMAVYYEVI